MDAKYWKEIRLKKLISSRNKPKGAKTTYTYKAEWLLIMGKINISFKSNFYQSKFPNTCMSYKKLSNIFDISALMLS